MSRDTHVALPALGLSSPLLDHRGVGVCVPLRQRWLTDDRVLVDTTRLDNLSLPRSRSGWVSTEFLASMTGEAVGRITQRGASLSVWAGLNTQGSPVSWRRSTET